MYDELSFYVSTGKMELFGEEYDIGQISADVLNVAPPTFNSMYLKELDAEKLLAEYEAHPSDESWEKLRAAFQELDEEINQVPVLKILNISHEEPPGLELPEKDRRFILCQYFKKYRDFFDDIKAFNITIQRFVTHFLLALKHLSPESITQSLNDFFTVYGDLTANPFNDDVVYTFTDSVKLQFIPREYPEGSGQYKLCEYYITTNLQAFLKIDFYRAIEYGYHVRRCEYCHRYFLSRHAYHTKYCDKPAPDRPEYTCAQLGYHVLKKKERAGDSPKTQSLHRCDQRIAQDRVRGIITEEEADTLRKKARELHRAAVTHSGTSDSDFENQLRSENLYPLCGIKRKSGARGRPKKQ